MEDRVTKNIGAEYDEKVWNSLRSAITELNGKVIDEQWSLAGSQEFNYIEVDIGGGKVEIESETYLGISISGPFSMIEKICNILERS